MYWSSNEVVATPYFSKMMSRNRFQLIMRMLHFSDNTEFDAWDRLNKIRPVLSYNVYYCVITVWAEQIKCQLDTWTLNVLLFYLF